MPAIDTTDWRRVVQNKHLIFDTDAIITLLAFQAEDIFNRLKDLNVTFNYIHPVVLELMATGSQAEKSKRTSVLLDYDFTMLPIAAKEQSLAVQIQSARPLNYKGNPSVADYYLAAALAKYAHTDSLLLTSNVKDFPLPLFPRKAVIPLTNMSDLKTVAILGFDQSKLTDF